MLIPLAEATQLSVIEGDHAGPPHLQALREWLLAVLPTIYSMFVEALGYGPRRVLMYVQLS